MGWWKDQNRNHRHLWPGTSIGRMTGQGGPTELLNQILITRGMTPDSPGICMFSMRTLQSDDRLAEALLAGPYSSSALIPPSPWLDGEPPSAPDVLCAGNEISWTPRGEEDAFLWVAYVRRDDSWSHRILPGRQRRLVLQAGPGTVTRIAVSAVDRCGNEGPKTVVSVR